MTKNNNHQTFIRKKISRCYIFSFINRRSCFTHYIIQGGIMHYIGGHLVLYSGTLCIIQGDILHYIGGHSTLYRRTLCIIQGAFCIIQEGILYYIGGAFCILVETFMGHKANVPHFFVIDYLFFFQLLIIIFCVSFWLLYSITTM